MSDPIAGFWPDAPPMRVEYHDGRTMRCFTERPTNIDAMLHHTSEAHGACEAVVDGDLRMSHRELHASADALAHRLIAGSGHEDGLAGARVVLLAQNGWRFVVSLIAIIRAGGIAVPLGTRLSRAEIEHIALDCGAVLAIADPEFADRLPDALGWMDTARIERTPRTPASPPRNDADESETAVLLYTSGTTGRPKGAMLSHRNLVHSCMHYRVCFSLDERDRVLMAVPASHVTGLVAIILAPLAAGGAIVCMAKFDADDFLALAAREAMTVTMLVPAMYNLCLLRSSFADHDLSAWRIGSFGGAPMPAATMERLAEVLPDLTLVQAYGSTETTSPATVMPVGRQAGALLSVGAPVACADILVMDEAGREVRTGESGEIWIAGPMVSSGYWNDPERTAEAFHAGYWRSGDIGRFDKVGLLYVHDRIKDMINRGGYKVFSAEVENVLNLHKDVVEAAVVARPDPVLGEKTHAVVVLNRTGTDAPVLRAHCAALLADYKVPDTFEFTEQALPRNANGKLQKNLLTDGLAHGGS